MFRSISNHNHYVVFIWRTTNLRWIQDDIQGKFDCCLLYLLVRSLTRWLTHWQTDWSDYPDVLIKDSVGTNWMLSGEWTLPVLLLPALHPLQSSLLSDCNEQPAKTYRHVHRSTRTCYGYWRLCRLRCGCCLCRCVDVSNKIAFEIIWFKVVQWTTSGQPALRRV